MHAWPLSRNVDALNPRRAKLLTRLSPLRNTAQCAGCPGARGLAGAGLTAFVSANWSNATCSGAATRSRASPRSLRGRSRADS